MRFWAFSVSPSPSEYSAQLSTATRHCSKLLVCTLPTTSPHGPSEQFIANRFSWRTRERLIPDSTIFSIDGGFRGKIWKWWSFKMLSEKIWEHCILSSRLKKLTLRSMESALKFRVPTELSNVGMGRTFERRTESSEPSSENIRTLHLLFGNRRSVKEHCLLWISFPLIKRFKYYRSVRILSEYSLNHFCKSESCARLKKFTNYIDRAHLIIERQKSINS